MVYGFRKSYMVFYRESLGFYWSWQSGLHRESNGLLLVPGEQNDSKQGHDETSPSELRREPARSYGLLDVRSRLRWGRVQRESLVEGSGGKTDGTSDR
jgi:hypothetical protein